MTELPFHLQKLPPEALTLLRYMLHHGGGDALTLEESGLSTRGVLKSIRRLINADYIELKAGSYSLSSDGLFAAKQIDDYEKARAGQLPDSLDEALKVKRRLVIVTPRSYVSERPSDLYIGINAPDRGNTRLPYGAQVELRVTAVGATLAPASVSMDVPPDKAAVPNRLRVLPEAKTPAVRVRIDIFQAFEYNEMEALGGFYFDIPVYVDEKRHDKTPRAVGIDVMLKGSS